MDYRKDTPRVRYLHLNFYIFEHLQNSEFLCSSFKHPKYWLSLPLLTPPSYTPPDLNHPHYSPSPLHIAFYHTPLLRIPSFMASTGPPS